MSIQKIIQSRYVFLVLERLNLIFLYDFFKTLVQKFQRATCTDNEIFYEYYNSYTHPFIKKSFYKKNASFSWSNYSKSKIIWALQYPKPYYNFDKNIVIELNDHILTLPHFFGARTPSECLERLPKFSINAISEAISLLIDNPSTLRQMRLNSLELAHRDSISESNKKLKSIFKEILNNES